MADPAVNLKESILEALRERVGAAKVDTWFNKFDFIQVDGKTVHIPVPNPFYQDIAEKEFRKPIEDAFLKVFGSVPEIIFQVVSSLNEELWSRGVLFPAPAAPVAEPPHKTSGRDHEYTFESFVVGPSNRMAHAAAMAVCQEPAVRYNPLFIHGAVGLGKTHLLRAIAHTTLQKNPAARIVFMSCESFVNDFISAVRKGALEAFRHRYRSADVLLVDDVHFLANKESSQEEFFHTFNALHGARKQVVLSSDSPPKDIPTLKDRLVSRFAWGFVAAIDAPTFEMRMAILKNKAAAMEREISDDVLTYIADHVRNNIRELESAIVRLAGWAAITNREINLDLAREALKDQIESVSATVPVSVVEIQQIVCRYYGLKMADLQAKKWSRAISLPRQIGIYLARQFTHHSLKEVGGFFGGKDHATVKYSADKISRLLKQDPRVKKDTENLIRQIRDQYPR